MPPFASLIQRVFATTDRSYPLRREPEPMAPGPERHVPSPLVLAAALDRRQLGGSVEDVARLIETAEEISAGHPLGLVAETIMSAAPVTVGPAADWRVLSALFVDQGFRNLPVVDAENQFLGLIPLQTILRPGAQGLSARHLMQEAATCQPGATLAEVLTALVQGAQTVVPIVDADAVLVGMVTRSDIVAALVQRAAQGLVFSPTP